MAKVADSESGNAAAQQILEEGLTGLAHFGAALRSSGQPAAACRTRSMTRSSTLERWVERSVPETHGAACVGFWRMSWLSAKDAGKLLLQIEELKKIGFPAGLVQYLNAYYYINIGDYVKARQLLVPLQATMKRSPDLKAQVNVLLARCHSQLVEPEMEREAYLRAVGANPHDLNAKQGWINGMINQGDLEGAIREYRALVKQVPQLRLCAGPVVDCDQPTATSG